MQAPLALWWGSLEGADLETLVAAAATAGFGAVSAQPAMVLAAAQRHGDAGVRALVADHGVRITTIDPLLRGLPGACDPATVGRRWRAPFETDEDDAHRAADLVGAELINVAHFLGTPTPVEELADAIGALTARATAHGRGIVIEHMPEGAIAAVATAAAIAAAIDDPACGITLDTWHWWRSGGDLDELRAVPPGRIHVVQLADALDDVRGTGTTPPTADRLLPGHGTIPLTDVLGLLATAHPSARLGVEVFDRSRADAPPAEIAAANARALSGLGLALGRHEGDPHA
jgi:sugar phosphate isomerase/epimerase